MSKVTLNIRVGLCPSPHGQCPLVIVRTFLTRSAVATGRAGQSDVLCLPHIRLSGLSHKLRAPLGGW